MLAVAGEEKTGLSRASTSFPQTLTPLFLLFIEQRSNITTLANLTT